MTIPANNILRQFITEPARSVLLAVFFILLLGLVFASDYFIDIAKLLLVICAGILVLLLVPPNNVTSLITFNLLALSTPFAHFALFVIAGQGFQLAHLFALLLIAHLIVKLFLGLHVKMTTSCYWLVGYLIIVFLSVINILNLPQEYFTEYWKSGIQIILGAIIFFAILHLRPSPREFLWLLKAMILLSVPICLYGIYQIPARFLGLPYGTLQLTNPSHYQLTQTLENFNLFRASSIFSEPSFLGKYIVTIFAPTFVSALYYPNLFGKKIVLGLIITIQIAALLVCMAMTGYYLFILLVISMVFLEKGSIRLKIISWVSSVSIISLAFVIALQNFTTFPIIETIVNRVIGIINFAFGDQTYFIRGESLGTRISTAIVSLKVWQDYPFLGSGLGSFTLISPSYGNWNLYGLGSFPVLIVLAETGIWGLLFYYGFLLASLYEVWRGMSLLNSVYSEDENIKRKIRTMRLVSSMMFYMLLVQFYYLHFAAGLYQPVTWFTFGFAAIVALVSKELYKRVLAIT